MRTIKFYDTSSLLINPNCILSSNTEEEIYISIRTLQELENIKSSANKDEDIKEQVRQLIRLLEANEEKYTVLQPPAYVDTNKSDSIILETAHLFFNSILMLDELTNIYFVTNDLAMKMLAKNKFFTNSAVKVISEKPEEDKYTGYQIATLDDETMAAFYQDMSKNIFNLQINQYLIIKDMSGEIVDRLCWTGETHRNIYFPDLESVQFGKIKPKDVYQQLAADSFANNKITLVKGPAGSGKSLLSLGYLMRCLEKHKIDKIIVFCNTVATKGSAKLGYYPGSRDQKLLDSQIGNLLASKLGSITEVERMIADDKLVVLPCSDIRGYDTSGQRAGIYISEAQNLDVQLMKLILQRIGEDSICIIDGDVKAQVDLQCFEGANNGMRRVSKIFQGEDIYGEIELKNIWRSRIATIAEKL